MRNNVVARLYLRYARSTPITRRGLRKLYDIAESRGYDWLQIYNGLERIICKNYLRSKYTPPYNDPEAEVLDERDYIEDWEFK